MKKVAVIMGSDSDWPVVKGACQQLETFGIPYEAHILSAHRTPAAAEALAGKGRKARVVSMPCAELFDAQPAEYKENVLPRAVRARVAVEAASVDGWWKYVGLDGAVVGMSGFGESAPGDVLFKHFGFTVDHVVDVAEGLLK